jgi:UDP-4-amino-4,6-dideoxy-N-acetyl-beta-L-altrosamine transaminase
MIPYSCQTIDGDDIQAVVDVLKSSWLTQGPTVERFEQVVAGYCGNRHAVAVSSATAALHLACLAIELGPGDCLWTSPITYVASANCARYCGADVDFVDIDLRTFNLSSEVLSEKLAAARQSGKLPKAVLAVHMAGAPCDMRRLRDLADEYGFYLLEDASHALGSRYAERPIGSPDYADITVFSFHPVKNITTGEGGMAVTRNSAFSERMRLLRSHGVTRDPAALGDLAGQGWYYEQQELGYNYRLTDIQSALGISQMSRLDAFTEARNRIAGVYRNALESLPLSTQVVGENDYSACHLFIVRLHTENGGLDRRKIFDALRARGIGVNVHYIPVHTQPYYRSLGFEPEKCPESLRYYDGSLSLPIFPRLTDEQQAQVISALGEVLE